MPTRVIDVRFFDDEAARLPESSGRKGRYLTLSHYWGPSVHALTKKDVLETFKVSIGFENLLKKFQDAIVVAKKLRFDFSGSILSASCRMTQTTGSENLKQWA